MSTIQLNEAGKVYKTKERLAVAVVNVTLTVEQGEFLFVVGSRGAGKSTLLGLMCGAVKADSGKVLFDDMDMKRLARLNKSFLRDRIGYVRQNPEHDPEETVKRAVAGLGKLEQLRTRQLPEAQIEKALSLVGLVGYADRRCGELSPAEARRMEVARAIMYSPDVLLLDEVTDKMDDDTVWDLMHLFTELNNRGTTIVMATNASRIVNAMRKRVVTLSDGHIAGDVQKARFGQISDKAPAVVKTIPRRSRRNYG